METTAIPPAVQAQIDALEANVQGLKKRHSPLNEVDHRTGSPFCVRIRVAQPPEVQSAISSSIHREGGPDEACRKIRGPNGTARCE